jgi:hypothetical protein
LTSRQCFRCLDLLGRVGHHPGVGNLRRALAIYRDRDPAFERSKLERRFRGLVKRAGLPAPAMNFNVFGYELDAYWEPERFVVELDVYETHGSHAAFERDRLRQEDLKLKGVEMIRVTGPRLDLEPDAMVARVAAHLAQRRRELGLDGWSRRASYERERFRLRAPSTLRTVQKSRESEDCSRYG